MSWHDISSNIPKKYWYYSYNLAGIWVNSGISAVLEVAITRSLSRNTCCWNCGLAEANSLCSRMMQIVEYTSIPASSNRGESLVPSQSRMTSAPHFSARERESSSQPASPSMVKEPRDFLTVSISATSPYDGTMRWIGSPEMVVSK